MTMFWVGFVCGGASLFLVLILLAGFVMRHDDPEAW